MKRITFIIMAAMMAVFGVHAETAFDCAIETTDVQPYSATVKFTPKDNNVYYVCSFVLKSSLEDSTEEEIISYLKSKMDASIEEGSASSYADFAHIGETSYTKSGLSPVTEYVAIAYSIDEFTGEATSSMAKSAFTTIQDVPTETDVYIHIVDTHWYDKVESNGWWQIKGQTEEYDYSVTFCADPATKSEGTFTLTNTSWDWNYTGVYYYPSAGSWPVLRTAVDMTVTISKDEKGVVSCTAVYLDNRGVTYHITYDPYDPEAKQGETYDMKENLESSFFSNEGTVKYDETEGCFMASFKKSNGEYFQTVLYSGTDNLDDGTYAINSSLDDMTAESCSYYDNDIYGTMYGVYDEDESMQTPWFWCTGGTIKVSHDAQGELQMEVAATNTWGKTGNISIRSAAAVKSLDADKKEKNLRKYIEGGTIVIMNNGKKYNLAGQRMK